MGWDGTQPRKGDTTMPEPQQISRKHRWKVQGRVAVVEYASAHGLKPAAERFGPRPQDRARVAGPREGRRRGRARPEVPEAPAAPDPRRNGASHRGGPARVRLGRLPYAPLAPSGPPDQGGRQDHRADLRGSRPRPAPRVPKRRGGRHGNSSCSRRQPRASPSRSTSRW